MAKVLLVDDHQDILYNLAEIIELFGHDVQGHLAAKDALRAAPSWQPDIIITDVIMPEMDGFAFFEAIKKDRRISEIPVVFLTAAADEETRKHAEAIGVNEFIVKPTSYEALLDIIEAEKAG